MQLVSMKTESEADDVAPEGYDDRPCLHLTDDQVEALGIKGIPAPGAVFKLQCRAVVERVSAESEEPDEGEGNAPDVYLTLRVTDMAAAREGADAATMLYGG